MNLRQSLCTVSSVGSKVVVRAGRHCGYVGQTVGALGNTLSLHNESVTFREGTPFSAAFAGATGETSAFVKKTWKQ